MSANRLSSRSMELLRCPVCKGHLAISGDRLNCATSGCARVFPIVNEIPVLINEDSSIFDVGAYTAEKDTFWKTNPLRDRVLPYLPDLTKNVTATKNFARLRQRLIEENKNSLVLIIGGSRVGEGILPILEDRRFDCVESDISFGPRTNLISDGHDLPFADGVFDCVIVQAVLEHVVDPPRVADEIYRVLRPNGLVYADTPFMQQVHAGAYDFMRFSPLGHRRLFRRFEEIERGVTCGPAMALGHSIQYLLLSPFTNKSVRIAVKLACRFTLFWLKYFDYLLAPFPGAMDAASGSYFLGRRSNEILSDRNLIKQYRGAN